jgi:hypothetical protein
MKTIFILLLILIQLATCWKDFFSDRSGGIEDDHLDVYFL